MRSIFRKCVMTVAAMIIALICSVIIVSAAPYNGQVFEFLQPNGTMVSVKVFGDEFYHRVESIEGYTLIRDKQTGYICYAKLNRDGLDFDSTGVIYNNDHGYYVPMAISQNTPKRLNLGNERLKEIVSEKRSIFAEAERETRQQFNLSGSSLEPTRSGNQEINGMTIVIDFADVKSYIPTSQISDFMNQVNYSDGYNNGSVRDYFYDVSGGMIDYTNDVFYYESPNPFSYYDNSYLDFPESAAELVVEALDYLASSANVNNQVFLDCVQQLTVLPNGRVPLNIYYAGASYVWMQGLWPHSWGIYLTTINNKPIIGYQITNIGDGFSLRTFLHENGHMLFDFPDLYDYTDATSGIGNFCLMAYGGNDFNPVPPCPYLRINAGWGETKSLNIPVSGSTVQVETNALGAYKYSTMHANEYFLLEHVRKDIGRYGYFPGDGIVIYHIDEHGSNDYTSNTSAYGTHARVFVELADTASRTYPYLLYEYGNQNNVYPYGNNKSFSQTSVPNSSLWNGTATSLNLGNLTTTFAFGSMYIGHYRDYQIISKVTDMIYESNKWKYNTISLEEKGAVSTGNVFVVIKRYNASGGLIHEESKSVRLVSGFGVYTPVSSSAHIDGIGDRVEILIYDDSTCQSMINKQHVVVPVFKFN